MVSIVIASMSFNRRSNSPYRSYPQIGFHETYNLEGDFTGMIFGFVSILCPHFRCRRRVVSKKSRPLAGDDSEEEGESRAVKSNSTFAVCKASMKRNQRLRVEIREILLLQIRKIGISI